MARNSRIYVIMPLVCSDPTRTIQLPTFQFEVPRHTLREFVLIRLELLLKLTNPRVILVEQDLGR